MKKVLLSLSVLFLFLSCSKDPEPETLEKALGDRVFAQYLSGTWNYTFTGKGMVAWSESLIFNSESNEVRRSIMSNMYETISKPEITRTKYTITGSPEKIVLKSESGIEEIWRIEKVSSTKFIMRPPIGTSQLDTRTYTRAK